MVSIAGRSVRRDFCSSKATDKAAEVPTLNSDLLNLNTGEWRRMGNIIIGFSEI